MKKRVLIFGDSNTWGYNGENRQRFPDEMRWTTRLQEKLGDGYTVIDEGLNGRTSIWYDPVENIMSGLDYLWPCMKSHNPFDLIVILLGCNDCKPLFSANPWSIAKGNARLAEMAMKSPFGRDGNPPQVLLMAPLYIGDNIVDCQHMLDIYGPDAPAKSRQLAPFYKTEAETLGCFFADAAQFAQPGVDAIHMDKKYLDSFAESMKAEIVKIIG